MGSSIELYVYDTLQISRPFPLFPHLVLTVIRCYDTVQKHVLSTRGSYRTSKYSRQYVSLHLAYKLQAAIKVRRRKHKMMINNNRCLLLFFLLLSTKISSLVGFVLPTRSRNINTPSIPSTSIWSSLKEDETKQTSSKSDTKVTTSTDNAIDHRQNEGLVDPDAEGLPWWWELVWKLDIMKKEEQGKAITFGDSANVLRTNIEQIYGGYPSLDGCPLAEGELNDIADGTMFVGLQNYYQTYGSPYKLCFGPKSFLVISDPIQAKHLLRDANKNYDKVRKK